MTDKQQPEAMRLALDLEALDLDGSAAAVRRMHAENETLRAALAAGQATAAQAAPAGFDLHATKGLQPLCQALERAESKGYLPDAVASEWEDFEYRVVPAQPAAQQANSVQEDALADSQYLAGVQAGWNAAQATDPNAALRKIHESRAGYLKPLRTRAAQEGK